jgi:hypothetical protein
MKTIQFVGSLTIQRELYIDAPLQDVAVALNKDPKEVENMSQDDLEELLMDNIYLIDVLCGRVHGFEHHDDYMGEELHELIVNDTDEVVE